jgi:S-adenosyl-L-methionine hydrolase (adenosine-forming)
VVGFPVDAVRIITLTTDFGTRDAYVASMKGVILGIVPRALVVDVSHDIPPQNVAEAAYVLAAAYRYFSPDTIHVAVVDPGVGTTRRALAVRSRDGIFVGPDNGILCPSLVAGGALDASTGRLEDCQAVELTNEEYFRRPVSQTFHGRDIFAPVAAHLARGVPLSDLGKPVHELACSLDQPPERTGDVVRGAVIHIDRFGNAVTNLAEDLLPTSPMIEVRGVLVQGLASDYQSSPLSALVGSTGRLEIAVRDGSAAESLGLAVGDEVLVREGP